MKTDSIRSQQVYLRDEQIYSESESSSVEESSSEHSEQPQKRVKKRRVVRKKYKPRKKDIFLHTICIMNKNQPKPENSIIETYLLNNPQSFKQTDRLHIKQITNKTDTEFLKKFMDNIKFTQKLNQNVDSKNVTTQNIIFGNPMLSAQSTREAQVQRRLSIGDKLGYLPLAISSYLNMVNNIRFYG